MDLDLDPAQLHRALPAPDHDHGVVERDLRGIDAADPQREGAPAGAYLEHLVEPPSADDGAQPASHRTVRTERGQPRRRQDLGHLQALAEPTPLGGPGVLQRDLVVATAAPGAHDEPGAGDAPVVGVEVGVDQAPGRAGEGGHRPAVARLDGQRREGGEPALDRPQIERVELPLDLDGVVLARLVALGIGHRGQATAGLRRRPGAPPIAAVGAGHGGKCATEWRDDR